MRVLRHKKSRWMILSGATRSGKTHVSYYVLLREIAAHPEGNILLVGKTLATLSRNVIEPMQSIFGERHVSPIKADSTGARKVTIFGRQCYCVGANDSVSENKIRGMSVSVAYCDEIVTYDETFFLMLKTRLDKADSRCIATCNPESPSHFIKTFIDKAAEDGVDVYDEHFTIYDNTFLDREVITAMENEFRGTIYFDKWILGKWVKTEGLVFPLFNREKHYLTPEEYRRRFGLHSIRYVIWGGDGATTNDATAIEPLAILDNGQGVMIDPFYQDPKVNGQMSNEQLVPYIKRYLTDMENNYHLGSATHYMPVDCAAADLVLTLAYNLPAFYNVRKFTKKDILSTTDVVNNALSRNAIIVLNLGGYYNYVRNEFVTGERQLVKDLENMVWDETRPNHYDDKIPNDTADAFRYAVCTYYANPENLWNTPTGEKYLEG